jgi:hypothetical protein
VHLTHYTLEKKALNANMKVFWTQYVGFDNIRLITYNKKRILREISPPALDAISIPN